MILVIFNILLLICTSTAFEDDELSPIVTIEQGQVQGTIKYASEGRPFYAYRGIPYAKPPVGPLRFQPPESAEPWSDVFQATSDPPICIQPVSDIGTPIIGVEDCLQLDVYTPQLPTNDSNPSLTVHVYIHGGSFYCEGISYENLNPERYMNHDMVVVTLQYRLGIFGFYSTNDEAASGNYGLLDQNLALRWVQKNIADFGGNPNNVVLTGQSAGSASVLYQYISPLSAGLFHRVIAESGSPTDPWAMQEHPLQFATEVAETFNCSTNTTTEMVECLRQVDAIDLSNANADNMVRHLGLTFVPNVETSSSGLFLTEDPLIILQQGNFNKVPLQLGFNRDEGDMIFRYVPFLFQNITDLTFDVIIPLVLHSITDFRTNLVNVSYAIKEKYYDDIDLDNQTAVNIATIKWISDGLMKAGVAKTAQLVSSHNVPTYFYAFNYVSSRSLENYTGEPDVMHHIELHYLWYRNVTNEKDAAFGDRFFNLWIDFIFNGNHEGSANEMNKWLITPPGEYNYYEINDDFIMHGNYDVDAMDFWWYTVPAIVNA
ncbi:hypothetical protein CHUAL_014234 [Chamberlinius hualienensis]